MANKAKVGLDYFPFEVDFFNDIKLRKLIKYQSCGSVSIYTLLLCIIYKNGYYMLWDSELPFIISEKTGYEEGYVNEVISCCFKVGLLSKSMYENHNILTSKGIQNRYEEICRLLKRKFNVSEFSLIDSEELCISSEELNNNSEEKTQRKVKESKGNEIKEKESESAPIDQFSILHLKQSFNSDFNFKVCRDHKISHDENMRYQDNFFKEIDRTEENLNYKTVQKCRFHYDHWLKRQLEKEKSSAKKEKPVEIPQAERVYVKD
jgi:hypothetical protein